jgi:hypothetical protein
VSYTLPNSPSSTVDLLTISSTNYTTGSSVNLYYDTKSNVKPVLAYFRIRTYMLVIAGLFFFLIAYIDYIMAKNKTVAAVHGAFGVLREIR